MNKIIKSLFVSLFLIPGVLGSTSHSEGAPKTRIGIMKFDVGEGVKSSLGDFLYYSLVDAMQASKEFAIVDWEEIDLVVSHIVESHPNISEKDARRQAINQLSIQKMCIGLVEKVGEEFYVMVIVVSRDLTVDMVLKQSTGHEDSLGGCIIYIAKLLLMRLGDADKLEKKRESRQVSEMAAKTPRLPSCFIPVRDAEYPPLQGLAAGSREAQGWQRRAVEELKLPLEVKMQKTGIAFRLIPAGRFIMSSPWPGSVGDSDEGPIHQVTISKPMYVTKFEITQGQWEAVMGYNPSRFKNVGENAPVENVSWKDCQEFCRMLGRLEVSQSTTFRLPTEAEWEYSCRAGTVSTYAGDIHWMGWYHGNGGETTHQAGAKDPNAWGLYDMHGNVLEWCQNWYKPSYPPEDVTDPLGPQTGSDRVLRGGSWYHIARLCTSAYRFWEKPTYRYDWSGLRVVATVSK